MAGFIVDTIGRRAFISLTFIGSIVTTFITYRLTTSVEAMMVIAPINGFFTLGCAYAWMAIDPCELFAVTVRSTAIGFAFNATRLIARVFPMIAGSVIKPFGGVSQAAMALGSVYLLGIILPWFLPETRGRTDHFQGGRWPVGSRTKKIFVRLIYPTSTRLRPDFFAR